MLGETDRRGPGRPTCPVSRRRRRRPRRHDSLGRPSATGARWSSSAAPTSTRAAASRRSSTACVRRSPPGARTVVLTNGCGGLRPDVLARAPGADQRPHQPDRRPRRSSAPTFVDLTDVYSPRLRDLCREVDPTLAGGCLRAVPRPALRDAGRDPDGAHASAATWSACRRRSRRSPPARPAPRCSGISLVTNLAAGHDRRAARTTRRSCEAGRDAADPDGRPARQGASADVCDRHAVHRRDQPGRSTRTDRARTPSTPVARRPALARRGPRPRDPRRAGGARSTRGDDGADSPTGSAAGSSSAPPGCAASWAPGPNRMNRVVVIRAAAGLAAYLERARRHVGRHRLRRPPQLRRVRARHRRGAGRRRAARRRCCPGRCRPRCWRSRSATSARTPA